MKTFGRIFKVLRGQEGYSLVEFAITMGLVAIVAGGVFSIYKYRVQPQTWATARYDLFTSVMAALQAAYSDNGNAYPAVAAATALPTTNTALAPYLGTLSNDITTWKYTCPSGTGANLVLTVDTSSSPNADAASILTNKINNTLPTQGTNPVPAQNVPANNVVTVTLYNVTCQ